MSGELDNKDLDERVREYKELFNNYGKLVTISVANDDAIGDWADVDVVVNPDRIYTALPLELSKRLGIRLLGKKEFAIEGGDSIIQREVGYARIRYQGLKATVPLAFIEPEDEKVPTLGMTGIDGLNPIIILPAYFTRFR